MNAVLTSDISVIAVFLQGLFSFFSPCVLPLLPVYFGYLSGGTGERNPDGSLRFDRGKVLLNTLLFVLGISSAFFLLGLLEKTSWMIVQEVITIGVELVYVWTLRRVLVQ